MNSRYVVILALALGGAAVAAEQKKADVNPVAGIVTPAQMQEGWIGLFDGATTFGWKIEGDSKAADGVLVLGGEKATVARTTTRFSSFQVSVEYSSENVKGVELGLNGEGYDFEPPPHAQTWVQGNWTVESKKKAHTVKAAFARLGSEPTILREPVKREGPSLTSVAIHVPAGRKIALRAIKLQPLGTKPIFNGKDLSGWKPAEGKQSIFSVVDGAINVKDGGGDLQSEWQGDNFVLQLDVISNGKNLNSGIFFRALPGEYWQGYEAQVRNEWDGYSKDEKRNAEKEDRGKPVDIGTGGLYNRQPTRRVVSSDHEWFTMTVVADGSHFATWVNGYQCTDFVDEKEDAPSARKGRFLGKGCVSIQGHDPTTDLSFKNIRVAELPKKDEAK